MNRFKTTLMAVIVLLITVGFLWFNNRTLTPKKATHEDVIAEAKDGGYQLIDAKQLQEVYDQNPKGFLLSDTRQEWEYRSGHIKGALNFPMEPTWFSRWRKKDALQKLLGPDKNRFIVFY
ncbi:MAG: rhodanese-like domain-containing protein [Deltaproteobacteria bacterium]|nr:rhodanese-like domain-containing protein [Deltaproteobacteria bacterium]